MLYIENTNDKIRHFSRVSPWSKSDRQWSLGISAIQTPSKQLDDHSGLRPISHWSHVTIVYPNKDKTPKDFQSSVVYKISCPGCTKSYIGKTDRCLYTRLKEHTTSTDSEIFKHTNTCANTLTIFKSILALNTDNAQPDISVHLTNFLFSNTAIIDKAKH